MEPWAARIKELADAKGLRDSDLARACGIAPNSVGQWFGSVSDKPPTKSIKGEHLIAVARELGTTAEWIMTGAGQPRTTSQPAGLDVDTLGTALTSMDKAVRGRGLRLERNLGKYAAVLAYAYAKQLSLFPNGVPPHLRGEYDEIVDTMLGGFIHGEGSGAAGAVEPGEESAATG